MASDFGNFSQGFVKFLLVYNDKEPWWEHAGGSHNPTYTHTKHSVPENHMGSIC